MVIGGTCFVVSGLALAWANRISWPERSRVIGTLSTRVGVVLTNKSNIIYFDLVLARSPFAQVDSHSAV